jgi:hypothetical protein
MVAAVQRESHPIDRKKTCPKKVKECMFGLFVRYWICCEKDIQ